MGCYGSYAGRHLPAVAGMVGEDAAGEGQHFVGGVIELYPTVEVVGGTELEVDVGSRDFVDAELAGRGLVVVGKLFQLHVVDNEPVVGVRQFAVVVHA